LLKENCTLVKNKLINQGDQIGRFFAYRVIVSFGQNLQNCDGLGYILGDIFKYSSGNPVLNTWAWRHGLHSGIVSARHRGAVGREIESRRCVGWLFYVTS
jgi:hypothetical protein